MIGAFTAPTLRPAGRGPKHKGAAHAPRRHHRSRIISPIGNNAEEVTASLKAGKSGIVAAPTYAEHGFRSQIHGMPQIVVEDHIDKRNMRFMGKGAAYNFLAMEQAIADSGLEDKDISNDRTGIIMVGGPSTSNLFDAHKIVIEKGAPKRMGPFMVTRGMSSTNSACLATRSKSAA